MLEDDDLMMDDDFIGGSSGSYGSGGGSGLDDGELSPEEIKKQGMTVEVMDFLESYTTMCSMKNAVVVSSIQKSLQQAVEGGPIPQKFDFRGNKGELREKRANDDYMEIILKPMSNVTFLRELDLSFNEIGNKGAKDIANFIKTDITLEILQLSSNNISLDGAISISQALQVNESLSVLNISYNPLGDDGGMHFANMLQINSTLNQLNIAGCNLGSKSLIAFATVLKSNDRLSSINISDNKSHWSNLTQSLQNDVMMHMCRMLKSNHTLVELKVAKMGITDWSTVGLLSQAIKESTCLKHLDVGCNKISRDGGVAIANALRYHPTVRVLKLSCCSLFDEGAEAIRDLLLNNEVIQCLHLDHNSITGRGIRAIGTGVKSCRSVKKLTLWGNNWDTTACEMFAEILGTVASETKIGATDDLLPPIFFASNIRQNPAFKNATGTTILKVSDLEKEKALSSADSSSRSKNTGITSETVDFLIYSVEGVLNVAQKAYNYIVD